MGQKFGQQLHGVVLLKPSLFFFFGHDGIPDLISSTRVQKPLQWKQNLN